MVKALFLETGSWPAELDHSETVGWPDMAPTDRRRSSGLVTYHSPPTPKATTEPSLIYHACLPPMVELLLVMTEPGDGQFSLRTMLLRA